MIDIAIDSGFAEIGAGAWLMGRSQPVAFFGEATRRKMRGFIIRDRAYLSIVETSGKAKCSDSTRPFLTLITAASPIAAVSSKILVCPLEARGGAELVKVLPMSLMKAICATKITSECVVMASEGRTSRIQVAEGETLSVRPESLVAWTGNRPTGFVRKLRLLDMILPRGPRDLELHFHGPCIVWIEGAGCGQTRICRGLGRQAGFTAGRGRL